MSLKQMNEVVADELRWMPRGPVGSDQNQYRAVFRYYRLNSLGRRPVVRSATAAHEATLTMIRRWNPGFEPIIRQPAPPLL